MACVTALRRYFLCRATMPAVFSPLLLLVVLFEGRVVAELVEWLVARAAAVVVRELTGLWAYNSATGRYRLYSNFEAPRAANI